MPMKCLLKGKDDTKLEFPEGGRQGPNQKQKNFHGRGREGTHIVINMWGHTPGICSSCRLVIGAILVDVEPNAPFLLLSTLKHKGLSYSTSLV